MSSIKFKGQNNEQYEVNIGKKNNSEMKARLKLKEGYKEYDLKKTPNIVETIQTILIEETKDNTIRPVDEETFWSGFSEKKYDYYGAISSNYFRSHNHIPNEVLNLRSIKRYKELRRNFKNESKALTTPSKNIKIASNKMIKKISYVALVASVCFTVLNNTNSLKRHIASVKNKKTIQKFIEDKKNEIIELFTK